MPSIALPRSSPLLQDEEECKMSEGIYGRWMRGRLIGRQMDARAPHTTSSDDDSVERLHDDESFECLAFGSLMAIEHHAFGSQKASQPCRDNLHSSLFPWLPRASEPKSGSVTADGPWRASLRNLGQGRQCSKVPLSPPLSLLTVPRLCLEEQGAQEPFGVLSSCHLDPF